MINKILMVIDAQEDFTRGALRNEEAINALPVIKDAVKFADENDFRAVYYTQDTHYKDYLTTQEGINLPIEHCIENTKGWEICEEVRSLSKSIIVGKNTFGYDSWHRDYRLASAEEIWLCGFCTDICVSANFQILKAAFPETPIIVIEDACAGVTPELHDAALKVMKSCQARIVKWEDLKKENEHEA